MSDMDKPVPPEVDIYRFILDRYIHNESGAEDLGYTMSRDLVIAEVMRGLGLIVTRHTCTMTIRGGLQFKHLKALTINGVFIGSKGVGDDWDELIANHPVLSALPEDKDLRVVSDSGAAKDRKETLRTEQPYRGMVQQWVSAEVAYMQGLLLHDQTPVVSAPSSGFRL